jgi:hypothetical protein
MRLELLVPLADIGATPVKTVVETMRSAVSRTNASGMPNGARSSRFLRGGVGRRSSRFLGGGVGSRNSRCFSGCFGSIPIKLVALVAIMMSVISRSSDCSSTIMISSSQNGWRVIVGEGVGVNR